MDIFLNLDGSCEKVTPQRVYQGSNNVTEITVIAPFPDTTVLQIGFILPNGLYYETSDGARYVPMEFVPQSAAANVSVWRYRLTNSVTADMGDLYVAINAVTVQGNTTSYLCKVVIEESVLPNLPQEPEPSVYDLILLYLQRLEVRTENVPNLVADIQKVASNAFTFTNNSGVESAPIILSGGGDAPIPVGLTSVISIPSAAWEAVYDGTDIAYYKYLLTAGMHGQMKDGATAHDLWVSFDATEDGGIYGSYARYTVSDSGDVTLYVNEPIPMTMRVWNGKSIVDTTARSLINQEQMRAESEEAHLQSQIDELVNSGIDTTARAAIAAETQRAEAAENALGERITAEQTRAEAEEMTLQTEITAEQTRAEAAESALQSSIDSVQNDITDIGDKILPFTTSGWTSSPSEWAYLGANGLALNVPSGKKIIGVFDSQGVPRGTWRDRFIYANAAFTGYAIIF